MAVVVTSWQTTDFHLISLVGTACICHSSCGKILTGSWLVGRRIAHLPTTMLPRALDEHSVYKARNGRFPQCALRDLVLGSRQALNDYDAEAAMSDLSTMLGAAGCRPGLGGFPGRPAAASASKCKAVYNSNS